MRMRSPFFRCFATMSTNMASACFFGMSWLSESDAARCLRVTVACAADLAGAAALGVFAADLVAGAFFAAMLTPTRCCSLSCIVTESRFVPQDKHFLQSGRWEWGTFQCRRLWRGGLSFQ